MCARCRSRRHLELRADEEEVIIRESKLTGNLSSLVPSPEDGGSGAEGRGLSD